MLIYRHKAQAQLSSFPTSVIFISLLFLIVPSGLKKYRIQNRSNIVFCFLYFVWPLCCGWTKLNNHCGVILSRKFHLACLVETLPKPNHNRSQPPAGAVMSDMLVMSCTTCWRRVFCQVVSDRFKIQEEKCLGRRVLSATKFEKWFSLLCSVFCCHYNQSRIQNYCTKHENCSVFYFVFCRHGTTRNDLSQFWLSIDTVGQHLSQPLLRQLVILSCFWHGATIPLLAERWSPYSFSISLAGYFQSYELRCSCFKS